MKGEEKMVSGEALAEVACASKYSEEDKLRWGNIIRDFNNLYWQAHVQTWGNTKWRGVQVWKPATDLWIYQELITEIKPDLIIETGTAFGGSALYMRDILDKEYPEGKIITIDISHEILNEKAKVPGIEFYLGGSTEESTLVHVKALIAAYDCKRVMVILDSDHAEEHVSKELDLYSPLVTVGSIIVIEDTNNHLGAQGAANSWSLRQRGFKKNLMCEKFMLTFNRDGYWEREA
jgi:cephalosporin hydroxylase